MGPSPDFVGGAHARLLAHGSQAEFGAVSRPIAPLSDWGDASASLGRRADGDGVAGAAHSKREETPTRQEEDVPSLAELRLDEWTAPTAEPAVRAAERAIVTKSSAALADDHVHDPIARWEWEGGAIAADSRRRSVPSTPVRTRQGREPTLRRA